MMLEGEIHTPSIFYVLSNNVKYVVITDISSESVLILHILNSMQ